ncbi:hypothetical protein GGS24DRAFT_497198 [Hypoxylon argillaceum]|nr:hypothetical protein GGS24DRAFT_497198 [Hypoxylon argillaceum]
MEDEFLRDWEERGYDPNDILRSKKRLADQFNRDGERRFQMESAVGAGVFGLAWKVKYTLAEADPGSTGSAAAPNVQHIVLKTDRIYLCDDDADGKEKGDEEMDDGDDDDEDDEEKEESTMVSEKKNLEILRWAKHVVNIITPPNDPLEKRDSDIKSQYMDADNWVYLEWLQNGTLQKLISRALKKDIELPNRILWRFFLCLMFGDFDGPDEADLEHTLTPVMKLIDLGSMRALINTPENNRYAIQQNIFDIGVIMVELIALEWDPPRSIHPSESEARQFRLNATQVILSNAAALLPNAGERDCYPKLDNALRGLVCACLATRPSNRPQPGGLATMVRRCINERDGQFYASRGVPGESDWEIRALIQELLSDAD